MTTTRILSDWLVSIVSQIKTFLNQTNALIPGSEEELTEFLTDPLLQADLEDSLSYFFRLCATQARKSGFNDEPRRIQAILENMAPQLLPWFQDCETQAELARIMSEGGEAVEAVRKNLQDSHLPQHSGLTVELADILIRCGDTAGRRELPLAQALVEKMIYNAGRERKHGKGS